MTEPTSVANLVASRFGGMTALARALGHTNPTTVQRWLTNGDIPQKQWPVVEAAAFRAGFYDITAIWLGQMHAQQESRRALDAARDAKKKTIEQSEVA